MFNRIRLAVAALFLAGAVAGTAACSSGPTTYPAPSTWYVTVAGQNYCGYIYSPYEIDMYGSMYGGLTCSRVQFPAMGAAVYPGTLGYALMNYRMTYDSFYGSGYWYDQFYAPIGPRYHVTLIQRNTYLSYTHDFDVRYGSQIKSYSAKAKWSNGKTGAYTFPANNSKAKNKPLTNGGGYSGISNSGTNNKTGTNTGKTGTDTKTNSGKTGTSSNSGGRRR